MKVRAVIDLFLSTTGIPSEFNLYKSVLEGSFEFIFILDFLFITILNIILKE